MGNLLNRKKDKKKYSNEKIIENNSLSEKTNEKSYTNNKEKNNIISDKKMKRKKIQIFFTLPEVYSRIFEKFINSKKF